MCCPPIENATDTATSIPAEESNSHVPGVKTYSASESMIMHLFHYVKNVILLYIHCLINNLLILFYTVCREYSQLIYTYIKDPTLISNQDKYIKVKDCLDVITLIVNGTKAEPKEFPHMVIVNKNILIVFTNNNIFLGIVGLWRKAR